MKSGGFDGSKVTPVSEGRTPGIRMRDLALSRDVLRPAVEVEPVAWLDGTGDG